jgi:hypothetical protein
LPGLPCRPWYATRLCRLPRSRHLCYKPEHA